MAEEWQSVSGFLRTRDGAVAAGTARPTAGALRGVVLLCPPLFEERKACAVVLARLAQDLAAAGFASLRVDPSGTGDSPGAFEQATVAAWRTDLETARQAASAKGVPVIVLGLRFGALLAQTVHASDPAAALVLWEPLPGGAEVLRQAVQRKLVNDMAAFGASETSRTSLEAAWQRGESVDLDGYRVSAALAEGLRGLLLPPPSVSEAPTLVLRTRAAAPAEAGSGRCHGDVQVHPTPPFWSTVGLVDVAAPVGALVAWLVARFPPTGIEAASWRIPLEPSFAGETHVRIPSSRGTSLQAVWHRPDSAPPRLRVLCLAGWTGCRLGPHNVFVTLARRLAQDGAACLRLDFGGRGDSPGDPARTSIVGMAEDARAALAWMRGQGPDSAPLALVAICSGGKVAITAASEESDLETLCLWSPEPMGSLRPSATNRRKSVAMLRAYAVKLLRAETWRKLLAGRVRGAMVGKALLRHETRSAEEARSEDAVLARFRAYRGRVFAVFGGGDPEAAGSERAYGAFFAQHRIPFAKHVIPRAGHSFYRADWADELVAETLCKGLSDRRSNPLI